jgi:hypothetical protein
VSNFAISGRPIAPVPPAAKIFIREPPVGVRNQANAEDGDAFLGHMICNP